MADPLVPAPSRGSLAPGEEGPRVRRLPMAPLSPPAPSTVPAAPPPPEDLEGAQALPPVVRNSRLLTLSDGTAVEPEYTTLVRDVSSETLLGISTGVSGEGPGAVEGTRGVDLHKTVEKALNARKPAIVQRLQGAPEAAVVQETVKERERLKADITAQFAKSLEDYGVEKADVNRAYNAARGTLSGPTDVLIDTDPGEVHRAIASWAQGEDTGTAFDWVPEWAREPLAPVGAMFAGHDIQVTTPGGVKAYNEGMNWGGLNWLGNMSLMTQVAQMYGTEGPGDWGGPEHLENIRRGEDVFTLWDRLEAKPSSGTAGPVQWGLGNVAKFTSFAAGQGLRAMDTSLELMSLGQSGVPFLDSSNPEAVEKAGDMVTAFGLALVDPDVVGTLTVGLGTKGVRKGAEKADEAWRAVRYGFKADFFQKALDEATAWVNSGVRNEVEVEQYLGALLKRTTDLLGPGLAESVLVPLARDNVGLNTAFSTLVTSSRRKARGQAEARQQVLQQAAADTRAAQTVVARGPTDPEVLKAQKAAAEQGAKEAKDAYYAARNAREAATLARDKARASATRAGDEGMALAEPTLKVLEAEAAAAEEAVTAARKQLETAIEARAAAKWDEDLGKAAAAGKGVVVDTAAIDAAKSKATTALTEATAAAAKARDEAKAAAKAAATPGKGKKGTKTAKAQAAEAYKAADEAYAQAVAAATEAKDKAIADATLAATKKLVPHQEALDFSVAAAEHLAEEALAADLEAVLKSVRIFKQDTAQDDDVADAVSATFDAALQQFVQAPAQGPEAITAASYALSEAAAKAGRHSSKYVEKKLEAMWQAQVKKAKEFEDRMLVSAKKAEKAKIPQMSRRVKGHQKQVELARNAAKGTAGHRGAMGLVVTLQDLSKSYRAMATKTEAGLTPGQRAMIENARRSEDLSAGAGMRSFTRGGLSQAYGGLAAGAKEGGLLGFADVALRHVETAMLPFRQYGDPGREAFGVDSAAVQQLVKGTENELYHEVAGAQQYVVDSLEALVAEHKAAGLPAPDEATRRARRGKALIEWMDGTGDAAKSEMRRNFGSTPWAAASPILRAVSKKGIVSENASEDERLFNALVKSFFDASEGSLGKDQQRDMAHHARKLLVTPVTVSAEGEKTFITFEDFAAAMTKKGAEVMDMPAGAPQVRDIALAARAVLQAQSLNRLAEGTLSLTVGLPTKAVDALAAVGRSNHTGAEEYMNVAMVLADRLGMPAHLKQQTMDSGKTLQEGLAILEDPENMERFFMPRRWMQRMEKVSGEVTKTADMFAAAHPEDLARRGAAAISFTTKWWNAGLLSGVLLPSPRYFVSNILDNISKVFIEMGAAQGTATLLASPLDLIDGGVRALPFIGEALHARVVAPAMLQVDKVLPSVLGSMYSPSVTKFFDSDHGRPGEVIGKSGITWAEARRAAIRQGVMTSSARSMGLHTLASRTEDKAFVRAVGTWTNAWAEMSDAIEQRQRVSMFLNLVVNKGMSVEEAGLKVRNAMYDWAHPLAEWEAQHVQRLFMFWGWQRRAYGQAFRTALSPFTAEYRGRMFSPLSRTVRTQQAMQGVREMNVQHQQEEYDDKWANVSPYWLSEAGSRVALGATMLPEEVRKLNAKQGKAYTHAVYTMPAPTQVETLSFLWSALGTGAMMAAGRPMDALDQGSKQLGQMLGPSGELASTQMRELAGFEKPFYSEDTTIINPFDKAVLGLMGATWKEGETTKAYRGVNEFYRRVLTPLSVNMAGVLNPVLSEMEVTRGLGHILRQQTGLGREHPYSPAQVVRTDIQETRDRLMPQVLESYRARVKGSGE